MIVPNPDGAKPLRINIEYYVFLFIYYVIIFIVKYINKALKSIKKGSD